MCSETYNVPIVIFDKENETEYETYNLEHFNMGWERWADLENWQRMDCLKDGIYQLTVTGAGPYPSLKFVRDGKIRKFEVKEWKSYNRFNWTEK